LFQGRFSSVVLDDEHLMLPARQSMSRKHCACCPSFDMRGLVGRAAQDEVGDFLTRSKAGIGLRKDMRK